MAVSKALMRKAGIVLSQTISIAGDPYSVSLMPTFVLKLEKAEEKRIERVIEDIKEGKASVRALKDYDMDLVLEVANRLREARRIGPDAYIKILDYIGRLFLARLLGYEDVPEPDPEAPARLTGKLKELLSGINPVEVVRDVRG